MFLSKAMHWLRLYSGSKETVEVEKQGRQNINDSIPELDIFHEIHVKYRLAGNTSDIVLRTRIVEHISVSMQKHRTFLSLRVNVTL